jgi:hypothetical protein
MAGNAIEVRAGDQGCVLARTPDKQLVYIFISRTGARGWIPKDQNHIRIGTAICGRITHKGDFPIAPKTVSFSRTAEVTSDLYPRTIYACLCAIGQEGDKIQVSEKLTILARSTRFCAEFIDRIEEGARRVDALQVLNRENFTLD